MKNLLIGMFAGVFLTTAIAAGPAMDQLENWKRDDAINNSIIYTLCEGDTEKISAYTIFHVKAYERATGKQFLGWMCELLAKMGDKSLSELSSKINLEVIKMIQEMRDSQPVTPTQPQRYDV